MQEQEICIVEYNKKYFKNLDYVAKRYASKESYERLKTLYGKLDFAYNSEYVNWGVDKFKFKEWQDVVGTNGDKMIVQGDFLDGTFTGKGIAVIMNKQILICYW